MFSRFSAAFQFLTILPLFKARRLEDAELARSMAAFPLVGAVLGLFLAAAYVAVGTRLPPLVWATLLIALLAYLTGGFHLDGVADTADGMGSARGPERALEIMKDSRIGSMGAIALILVLVLKISTLATLPPAVALPALMAFPAAGRGAVVHLAYRIPYARPQAGLGTPYTTHLDFPTVAAALVFGAALSFLCGPAGFASFLTVWAWVAFLRVYFRRKLGGITGDVLGFAEETGEAIFLTSLHLYIGIIAK